jgi:S1-C subfamily serine protease
MTDVGPGRVVRYHPSVRFLLAFLALLAIAGPAHADDVSAAGRGVVRVVTIATIDGEVVGFGHGSGFAVAPNRIVTNAHVVELAQRYPGNVLVGIVPSEGERSYQGRLVAIDQSRDLALIEITGVRLAPLALFNGPVGEGETVVALGYPGNVDLATARTAADFIAPLSPVRSQGGFSGRRALSGTQVLVHTANIARGNSGGPLLDRCGRVIGVNSALARADDGDASFAFAVAGSELASFLREAGQPATTVGTPCTTIEAQMAADAAAEERARRAAESAAGADAARTQAEREIALAEAREANARVRENFMGAAGLLLVLGAMAVGGGALLATQGRKRAAMWTTGAGGVVMLTAIGVFVARPEFDPDALAVVAAPTRLADAGLGRMTCRLVPERSRVTVSDTKDVMLDYRGDGCINGRTQYAEDGAGGWQRVLVPAEDATVSILSYQPASRTYATTRYLLSEAAMAEARRLRSSVTIKACTGEGAARANLAGQQAAIRAALPALPNEKLVYSCRRTG